MVEKCTGHYSIVGKRCAEIKHIDAHHTAFSVAFGATALSASFSNIQQYTLSINTISHFCSFIGNTAVDSIQARDPSFFDAVVELLKQRVLIDLFTVERKIQNYTLMPKTLSCRAG